MKIYEQIPELKSTAVALGCFDGIHLGHRAVIEKLSLPEYKNLNKAVFSFSDAPIFKEGAEALHLLMTSASFYLNWEYPS